MPGQRSLTRVSVAAVPPAPIAIFAFRRPEHVARLIDSLRANPEFAESPVVAYCDGARSEADAAMVAETRRVIRSAGIPNLRMVERERNLGLANSIISGVTELCAQYGRVIVLEDDLVLAPTFLAYMNDGLDRYADSPEVYAVNGTMYPVALPSKTDALFLPLVNSSGWATWSRAWATFDAEATGYAALARDGALRRRFDIDGNFPFFQMLKARVEGRNDSWAIRWYLTVFMRSGLGLFPARSLVENRGWGGDGATHTTDAAPRYARNIANTFKVSTFPPVAIDEASLRTIKHFVGRDFTLYAKARLAARAMLRRLGLV
jgi:hypothetical protein